jgi:3-deoxy-manno-octulosonate cytidylyltransferase (CMP-KDO synthetase)
MTFHVVIPARYASTRLPGKALLDIHGKPMIQWVVDASAKSNAILVVVATDDARIVGAVSDPRGSNEKIAVMTDASHSSGTDRVAEVARKEKWSPETIVVNVQGDEPHIPPELINQVAQLLIDDPRADVATLCTSITTLEEFVDPNVVKVVSAADGAALYFSRAPIPWNRDSATSLTSQREFPESYRHLGIYAYRVAALLKITRLPQSSLEKIEKLEQLRAMQAGMRIVVAQAIAAPGWGIDTPGDLERARAAPPPKHKR